MTKLFYFLVIILIQSSVAQTTEPIDSIILSYGRQDKSLEKDIYSKEEKIVLTKEKNNEFKISYYHQINTVRRKRTLENDTLRIDVKYFHTVPQAIISELANELNTNRDNYSAEYLRPFLAEPTHQQILFHVREAKKERIFSSEYNEKKRIERRFEALKNFRFYEEFIMATKPNLESFTLPIHDLNYLIIETYPRTEKKSYQMDFIGGIGQAIMILKSNRDKKLEQTININVNLLIQKIAPKESAIYKMADLNRIVDEYIWWVLQNKSAEL